RNGKDLHLSREQLDRIRMVDAPANPAPNSGDSTPLFGDLPSSKIPDTLMLKGIMGSGNKRMVMINNQSFFAAETAKVKVGMTNVTVQIVEIRDKSVIVRTNGQAVELFLSQ